MNFKRPSVDPAGTLPPESTVPSLDGPRQAGPDLIVAVQDVPPVDELPAVVVVDQPEDVSADEPPVPLRPVRRSGIGRAAEPSLIQMLTERYAGLLTICRHLANLYGPLVIAYLAFYALADYTAYTTAQQRPGQLIFSNTMVQLWTACFRLAFVLATSLGLLRLFWPELYRFFRPDLPQEPDMLHTIRYELTSYQRLCVFLAAFFGLCLLLILLLTVNLPETVSVGR